jgi:hypothetical protein
VSFFANEEQNNFCGGSEAKKHGSGAKRRIFGRSYQAKTTPGFLTVRQKFVLRIIQVYLFILLIYRLFNHFKILLYL